MSRHSVNLPRDAAYFVQKLLELGREVRGAILSAREKHSGVPAVNPASVIKQTSADTIYQIDVHVEPIIEKFCERWGREVPLVLVAEGIGEHGQEIFPRGTSEEAAAIRLIIDPIDGTRGLMYDKRSAWFLAGVAPNRGGNTRLSDIEVAAQLELPTSKQTLADILWAVRGQGARGIREEVRATVFQKTHDLAIAPSTASNIDHGFASVSNFFPSTKELASRLMECIVRGCLDADHLDKGMVFDDQYISTAGQFYELMMGHDRFNADLRPLFYQIRGLPPGLCVHPYDVASLLIAQEAGLEITDGLGNPLDGPLDITTPLHWCGYANKSLRQRIEPIVISTLKDWLARKG